MAQLQDLTNKKHTAFTLVEAVITLTIICGVLLIPAMDYQKQLAIQQEKLTLLNFQSNWNYTTKMAFLQDEVYQVWLGKSAHEIRFIKLDKSKTLYCLPLPQTLELYSSQVIVNLRGKQSINPTKIIFISTLTKKRYVYTVQMEWGQLVEKETSSFSTIR